MKNYKFNDPNIVAIIKKGGIGILPTDTLYGLVSSVFSKEAAEKVYKIKKRNSRKPLIILISSLKDLDIFGIKINQEEKTILKKIWPGKISVILPCESKKFQHLHRGTKTLALRWPRNKKLINFLKKTGPLTASSANPEGKNPALNIKEAKNYFEDNADFYINGGQLKSAHSTLISLKQGRVKVLRKGAVKI